MNRWFSIPSTNLFIIKVTLSLFHGPGSDWVILRTIRSCDNIILWLWRIGTGSCISVACSCCGEIERTRASVPSSLPHAREGRPGDFEVERSCSGIVGKLASFSINRANAGELSSLVFAAVGGLVFPFAFCLRRRLLRLR